MDVSEQLAVLSQPSLQALSHMEHDSICLWSRLQERGRGHSIGQMGSS